MTEFDMPEPTRLMVAGDWHGARHFATQALERAKRDGCEAVIQVGDFGYWPQWEEHTQSQTGHCAYSRALRKRAEELQIRLYWIDGNHENHHALEPGQGDEWLRHLPRGHRWNWWGKTWMAIGGGVSVDQDRRTPGFDWFPEEILNHEQLDHVMRDGEVDIVVAHDCPDRVEIPGVHGVAKTKDPHGWFPADLIRLSESNRALMGGIADDKHPAYWFHGHYHQRYNSQRDSTRIIGLGMNRPGHLDENIVVLTAKDVQGETDDGDTGLSR